MADINVTINPAPSVSAAINPPPEVDVRIGEGIPKHAVTHAPGGSDSLEAYYATTGSLAYVSGLTTGIGETGYLTGYVSKTETGNFYPASNPSGFITGVDLSNYVTGQVVRPSETGSFITASQTGEFYPASNPSGFITGVDLSSYATTAYVTGVSGSLQIQITNLSNSTGSYVTGSVVRPSDTGAFLTTGAADSRYALSSATGVFITTSQTGVFASQSYVTGVSGHLQTQVTAINNQTGNFVLKSATGNFITTSQTGQFVGTSQTGAFLTTGSADGRYVRLTGNQTVSGDKTFANRLIAKTGFWGDSNLYGNFGSQAIAGGTGNIVSGQAAFIGGGRNNDAFANYCSVLGGQNNIHYGAYGLVGGGLDNFSTGVYGIIVGGQSNEVYGNRSVIVGGSDGVISGAANYGFIGAGLNNQIINGNYNCINNGSSNRIAGGSYNFIGNGPNNIISGANPFVSLIYSLNTICGGSDNKILSGVSSAIIGGANNTITTSYANINGGFANVITESGSFASINGGIAAKADRYGMEARASYNFSDLGDAQRIALTLYGNPSISNIFSLNGQGTLYNIFQKQDFPDSVATVTCKILGYDSSDNISQMMRKITVKTSSNIQSIEHLESIGTDVINAGTVTLAIVDGVFTITLDNNVSASSRWIASIDGIEIVKPESYP